MPTIREEMKSVLISQGLFDSQADAILAQAESSIEAMQGRWGRPVSDYPPIVINQTYRQVKRIALQWINENIPDAWFKPVFEKQ